MLLGAIKTTIERKGLQPREAFVTKVLEVYEMYLVRDGFMVVTRGPPLLTSPW